MARVEFDPAWVVCHGQTRLIVGRSVACPLRGRVRASVCLGCRHLVTSSAERSRDRWCAAEEPAVLGSAPSRPASVPEQPAYRHL